MKFLKPFIFLLIISIVSCDSSLLEKKNKAEQFAQLVKLTDTPDQRVELFDIDFEIKGEKLILKGFATKKSPLLKVRNFLVRQGTDFIDNVRVLPDTAVGNYKYAVARNSVINIRSEPKHSAELGTQALLGMPLKVLDKQGDFYRVQTPDNYISWVDKGGITPMNKSEFDAWKNSEKIIFTETFGHVYSNKEMNAIISDISLGGMLQLISEDNHSYEVKYPDNRTGFVKKENAYKYDDWVKKLNPNELSIEVIAKKMDGFPYLWGGTSAKGMDCSGFTKMVYLMNGFIIPRDASQQVQAGKLVDKNLDFSDLQKGDLLFFGKKATEESKEKVTHVGIWLNNNKQEFIHASGNVHISSMDESHPLYDEFNKNRYLGSRRYLGVKDKNIIDLKSSF